MKVSLDVIRSRGVSRTDIEWCDFSANPVRAVLPSGEVGWACRKVSAGCANCYAETLNRRFGTRATFTASGVLEHRFRLDWGVVLRMLRVARGGLGGPWKAPDQRPKVFVGDMCDMFLGDEADVAAGVSPSRGVPDWMIDVVLAVSACRHDVDWLWLTKRPGRAADLWLGWGEDRAVAAIEAIRDALAERLTPTEIIMLGDSMRLGPNVWLGASVESQAVFDDRVRALGRSRAAVRFLSCEPLIAPVAIPSRASDLVDWVILGGESGPNARPAAVGWFRSLLEQCDSLGVPAFMKQMGSHLGYPGKGSDPAAWPAWARVREWPKAASRGDWHE